MPITLRWLEKGEHALGQRYIDELWQKDHILSRDEELYKWQYEYFADGPLSGFLIAEENGEPAACAGSVNVPCHVKGTPLNGSALTVLMVRPDLRSSGLGIKLLKESLANVDMMVNLGVNKKALNFYRLLKFHTFESFPRHIAMRSLEFAERYWKSVMPCDKFPVEAYEQCEILKKPSSGEGVWQRMKQENLEEWDKVWEKVFAPRYAGSLRHGKYIDWRYLSHPSFSYDVLIARDVHKNICGICACRKIDVPGGVTILRITDFLADNEKSADILMSGIYDSLPQNLAFVEYTGIGTSAKYLGKYGLKSGRNHLLSKYFSPPDLSCTDIPLAIFSRIQNYNLSNIINDTSFYITVADGDQDRPA